MSDITDLSLTKSDIKDLVISDSILSSSTCTLTEGTNYFTITLEKSTIEGVGVYLFKFTKTEDFASDKFSSFNLLITDKSNTIINVDMGYSDGKFTFSSAGTGIIDGIITLDSFYCGKLKDDLAISAFNITFTDLSGDVLCKYTLEPVYVDSSNLLTFDAIDETYVRKTEISDYETSISSHMHEISDITGLPDSLDNKADKDHTHAVSDITDLTISSSCYKKEYSIALSEGTDYFTTIFEDVNNLPHIYFYQTDTFKNAGITSFKISIEGYDDVFSITYVNGYKFECSNSFLSSLAISTSDNLVLTIYAPVYPINNNLIITDSDDNVLSKYTLSQAEVDSSNLLTFGALDETYTRQTKLDNYLSKSELLDYFYPVGSIYITMTQKSPADIFGGTWTLIEDKFHYCGSGGTASGTTGGSKTISVENLPAHTHTFTGTKATDSLNIRSTGGGNATVYPYNSQGIFGIQTGGGSSNSDITQDSSSSAMQVISWNYTPSGTLSSTGSGEEFLPPYIRVYAWYRTA